MKPICTLSVAASYSYVTPTESFFTAYSASFYGSGSGQPTYQLPNWDTALCFLSTVSGPFKSTNDGVQIYQHKDGTQWLSVYGNAEEAAAECIPFTN